MLNELEQEITNKYKEVLDVLVNEVKTTIITARILIGLLAILLFLSNVIWLCAWCKYDYVTEEITYTQDGSGINTFNSGMIGDIKNGADNQNN